MRWARRYRLSWWARQTKSMRFMQRRSDDADAGDDRRRPTGGGHAGLAPILAATAGAALRAAQAPTRAPM